MTTETTLLANQNADSRQTQAADRSDGAAAAPKVVRVWDPFVRLFHWGLVGAFATAYLVEDDPLVVHVWAGYVLLGLLAFRLLWGLIGPRHARFGDFVRGPRQVLRYLGDALQRRAGRHLGHNPAGGAMVVVLLVLLTATGLTGLAVYGAEEAAGPLAGLMSGSLSSWEDSLEEAHEVLANLSLILILLHVAGVLFSSWSHSENLIRSMITGRKRAE
jgi:cytochrome b